MAQWAGTWLSHWGRWAEVGARGWWPQGGSPRAPRCRCRGGGCCAHLRRYVRGLLIFPGGCGSARAAGGSVGAAVPPPPRLAGTHPGRWHPNISPPPCVPGAPRALSNGPCVPLVGHGWAGGAQGGGQGVCGAGAGGAKSPRDGVPYSSGFSQPPPHPPALGGNTLTGKRPSSPPGLGRSYNKSGAAAAPRLVGEDGPWCPCHPPR